MNQEKLLRFVSEFYVRNKARRQKLDGVRRFTARLRSFRLPFYKNLYDLVHFRSYYVVLVRIIDWRKPKMCFEWGPGLNSELFARAGAKVYSVEHHKKWSEHYKKKKVAGVELIYSPISQESSLKYPHEIKSVSGAVDVAFVDGRCRADCISSCRDLRVPVVIMHDSLTPVTLERALDGAPPISNEGKFYQEGYLYYTYFVEIVDLRTIVLVDNESDFRDISAMFSDFYIRHGKTVDYKSSN